MKPVHPNFRIAQLASDSPIRTLVEAQAEQRSDTLKTKSDLQSADTFTARSSDFTAGNSLTAAAATVEAAVLASAPAANSLYEAHFKVTINPIVPGAGTNTHKVTVSVETDPTGAAVWTEQWAFDYEVTRKVGETTTAVIWPSERMPVRVTGFNSSGKLRLKVKSASGPGGWTFSVHGFNLATDADLFSGVTYHTGPAIDFLDGGGATLADVVISKISSSTSNANMTDLGGPPLISEQAPYIVPRLTWGKDDSRDIAIDRFTAQLHPCVDGVPGNKTVAWWLCQPYAYNGGATSADGVGTVVTMIPLCDPVRVPADGTTAADYVFSFYDKTVTGPNHNLIQMLRKPRPKATGFLGAAVTYWFIWAVQADGSPATNVAWLHDTGVTEVTNGSRKLNTSQISRVVGNRWVDDLSTSRPVLRCKVECGSYAAANLEYTGGGNLIDLGAAPTETVTFVGVAGVPDGTGSVFEVRNDADSAWLTFTDGQTAAEVGVSQRQTYKVRWRASPNTQGDATPTLWEIGVRDIKKVWLSDLVKDVRAVWSIPDVAELVPSIPEAEIVLIKNGEQDFSDRVTRLFSENYVGVLSFRIWRGDPSRPRSEWLHKDDFALVDDYDPQAAEVTVIAHSPLVFVNGALPVYNTTTQKREPLQLSNKTPKQAYEEIVNSQLAPDVPGRFRGESLFDESTLISKTIEDSDGLTELNAIEHIAGCVLSTSGGKLKSFPMFGPGAVQVVFPSQKLKWASTAPGLRQRVPRFFVKYNYDIVGRNYGGEARLISGNDVLATNLKAGRIDARTSLDDAVCQWIPTEELAKRVGKRRVDTLGAGMLVWRFGSVEMHPELEFGDVVAIETDRFFARDPTQTSQRTLKGSLWAIARIVEHDLEGRNFGVWIQSYADIFGSTDAAIVGVIAPKPSSVLTYLIPNGEFEVWDATTQPHAWSVDTGDLSSATKETTTVFSGDFAAKFSFGGGGSGGTFRGFTTNEPNLGSFCVPLRAGVSYSLKVATRTSSIATAQSFRVTFNHDAARTIKFQKTVAFRAATTYQTDEFTFTVPSTAEKNSEMAVEFTRGGTTATDFWLDSLRIDELEVKELYDNGTKSGAFTIDWSNGQRQKVTLAASSLACTLTNPVPGAHYTLMVMQDVTGSRLIPTFDAQVIWSNSGTPPTLSTAAGLTDELDFVAQFTPTLRYHAKMLASGYLQPTPSVTTVTPTSIGAASTTHNINMTPAATTGELLLMIVAWAATPGAVTTPSGWTNGGTTNLMSVFWKVSDGTEGGTTVNVITGNSVKAAAQTYRITTWYGTTVSVEDVLGSGAPGTSADPSSRTPLWGADRDLWIAGVQVTANPTITDPANYANFTQTDDGSVAVRLRTGRRTLYAATEDPAAFTWTGSQTWTAVTIAVRPPA